MSNTAISVCIIAKNEEKHIEECLKHLSAYGVEIIVADTGSTDSTREIAVKYADKVVDFEWINDFSAARNYCAGFASNEWILSIDCDEYVEKIDMAQLKRYMLSYPQKTGTLRIKNITLDLEGNKGYTYDSVPRLYNKKNYSYRNAVHEQLVPINAWVKNESFPLPMEVTHYGYAITPEEMAKKQNRNLQLLYSQLSKEGETPYMCFQIAQSEMLIGHYETAVGYYEKALSYNESRELIYVQFAIEGLARAYSLVGRKDEAVSLMERYEDECVNAKYVYCHGDILRESGNPLKALVKYIQVTTMPDAVPTSNEVVKSYRHIIEIYHQFGEYKLSKFFEDKYAECLEARGKEG